MKLNFKVYLLVFISIMFMFIPNVLADEITHDTRMVIHKHHQSKLTDKKETTYIELKKGQVLNLSSKSDIYGLYIIYELKGHKGVLYNSTGTMNIGEHGYAHEYINSSEVFGPTRSLHITYEEDVKISEIHVLGAGELPSFVEIWEDPCDKADLLIFPTHSDDEHLFLGGVIPLYIDKGAKVQVVYFADHSNNPRRIHEQLHGLYEAGVRNYPVFGVVPDKKSYTIKAALRYANLHGITEENMVTTDVQLIRRFKPLVIVGHDEYGEYTHGQHILNTSVLKQAVLKSMDETYDKESVDKYGVWKVPKLYLHLYNKRKIVLNFDEPLKSFGGLTAYEVTKKAFDHHISQKGTWYNLWLNGEGPQFTKASEIETFSPQNYGLYYSNVGYDIKKNDMFENLYMRSDEKFNEDTIFLKRQITVVVEISVIVLIILGIIIIKVKKSKRKRK